MKKIYNLSQNKIELEGFVEGLLDNINSNEFNVLVLDDKKENKELVIKYQDKLGCVILNEYKGELNDIFFVPVIINSEVNSAPQYFYCRDNIENTLLDIEKFSSMVPSMRRISAEEISCKMVDLTSKKKKGNSNKLKILVG